MRRDDLGDELRRRYLSGLKIALEAAAEVARDAGLTPHVIGDSRAEEARDFWLNQSGRPRQVERDGFCRIKPY